MQGSTGWEGFGNVWGPSAIPVNNNAVVPLFQYKFSLGAEEYQEDAAKKAEELSQLTQQVTTARFCEYENSLIYQTVFMTDGSRPVAERLENLKDELRFYFEE